METREIEMTVIETVCTKVKVRVGGAFDTEDRDDLEAVWIHGAYEVISVEVTERHIEAEPAN